MTVQAEIMHSDLNNQWGEGRIIIITWTLKIIEHPKLCVSFKCTGKLKDSKVNISLA